MDGGNIVLERTTLVANSASSRGGAVLVTSAPITVTNSTFSGNRADDGGGIAANAYPTGRQPSVHVSFSTFAQNTSDLGAGIWIGNPDWEDVRVHGTLLDNPAGGSCAAFVPHSSEGDNLDSGRSCFFSGPGDLSSISDPRLGCSPTTAGRPRRTPFWPAARPGMP